MKRVATLMTILLLVVLGLSAKKYTLVIDPGHGGHDAGACGAFSKEKNINLNVALAFGKLVEQNCPDVKVVYTRKTDVFIPLNERANIANKAKADLFISVHTNALPAGRVARGFEVYTLGMHRAADNLAVAKRENLSGLRPQLVGELYNVRAHAGQEYGAERGTGEDDTERGVLVGKSS